MRTPSTISKHLDKNVPPWKCGEAFQDALLTFLTKREEHPKRQYHWHCPLDIPSEKFKFRFFLEKYDKSKCTYSVQLSDKATLIAHGDFPTQAELFTENIEETNVKSEKRKKLMDARNKFYELLPNLLQNHKGKYVAIVENNVEIDSDKDVLLNRVIKKYGYVSMYFDRIVDKRRIIKMSNRPRVRK